MEKVKRQRTVPQNNNQNKINKDCEKAQNYSSSAKDIQTASLMDAKKKIPQFSLANANIDLTQIIAGYAPLEQARRMLFVVECLMKHPERKQLMKEALVKAAQIAKQLHNVVLYNEVMGAAKSANISLELLEPDQDALDAADRTFNARLDQLNASLALAQRDQEIPAIQTALVQLAELHQERGDFSSAVRDYLKAKELIRGSTSSSQLDNANILLNIVECSILSNFVFLETQLMRLSSLDVKDKLVNAKINVAQALSHLKMSSFRCAATYFLKIDPIISNQYNMVIVDRDIAAYGTLTALVSLSRKELKQELLNNSQFQKFLDCAPEYKQLAEAFHISNYADAFKIFFLIAPSLMLDVHIGPLLNVLSNQLRNRAIAEYVQPYIAVQLSTMAEAFSISVETLESCLCEVIDENRVRGRIDSHNKIFLSQPYDQREASFRRALDFGQTYARDARALLMRMSLKYAEVELSNSLEENDDLS